MTDDRERRHPNSNDLYTPFGPDVLATLYRMRDELGSWRQVAAISETRLKVLRNMRNGRRKAISQRLWDRLITTTGVGSLNDLTWFTADDLVKLGIWKPPRYVEGDRRIQAGVTTVDDNHGKKSIARRAAEKQHKKDIKKRSRPRPNPFGITKPKWLQ